VTFTNLLLHARLLLLFNKLYCFLPGRRSVRPSVPPFGVMNVIFWKRMKRFRCKLALVVNGAKMWDGQIWGQKGQRSRSHDAEVRFGGQAEALFFTPCVE